MDSKQLTSLPSPFYRVAAKVLVMDELGRLLVTQNKEGFWEIPGGGWEHDETLDECIDREMEEELGAKVRNVGEIEFVLRGQSDGGWHVIRLVVRATLDDDSELMSGDDQVAYRFVNRRDFLQLKFCDADQPFLQASDRIWSE